MDNILFPPAELLFAFWREEEARVEVEAALFALSAAEDGLSIAAAAAEEEEERGALLLEVCLVLLLLLLLCARNVRTESKSGSPEDCM